MGLSIEKVHHGNWLPSERAKREQESVSRTKTESLCNLVSEVISEHFYYILFVRRKLLGSVNTQGEGIIKGHKYHKQGSWKPTTPFQADKRPSEHLKHGLHIPSLLKNRMSKNHFSHSIFTEKICECSFCLMKWIINSYMGNSQNF